MDGPSTDFYKHFRHRFQKLSKDKNYRDDDFYSSGTLRASGTSDISRNNAPAAKVFPEDSTTQLNRSHDSGFSQDGATDPIISSLNFDRFSPGRRLAGKEGTRQQYYRTGTIPVIKVVEDGQDTAYVDDEKPKSMGHIENLVPKYQTMPESGRELSRKMASDSAFLQNIETNTIREKKTSCSTNEMGNSNSYTHAPTSSHRSRRSTTSRSSTQNSGCEKQSESSINEYNSSTINSHEDEQVENHHENRRNRSNKDNTEKAKIYGIPKLMTTQGPRHVSEIRGSPSNLHNENLPFSNSARFLKLLEIGPADVEESTECNRKKENVYSFVPDSFCGNTRPKRDSYSQREYQVGSSISKIDDIGSSNENSEKGTNSDGECSLVSDGLFQMFGVKLSDFCRQLLHTDESLAPESAKDKTKSVKRPNKKSLVSVSSGQALIESSEDLSSKVGEISTQKSNHGSSSSLEKPDLLDACSNFVNSENFKNFSKNLKPSQPVIIKRDRPKMPEFSLTVNRKPIWSLDPVPADRRPSSRRQDEIPLYCKSVVPKNGANSIEERPFEITNNGSISSIDEKHSQDKRKILLGANDSKMDKTTDTNDLDLKGKDCKEKLSNDFESLHCSDDASINGKPKQARTIDRGLTHRVRNIKNKRPTKERSGSRRRKEFLFEIGLDIFKTIEEELRISHRWNRVSPSETLLKRIESIFHDHQQKRIRLGLNETSNQELYDFLVDRFRSEERSNNSSYHTIPTPTGELFGQESNLDLRNTIARLLSLPNYRCHNLDMAGENDIPIPQGSDADLISKNEHALNSSFGIAHREFEKYARHPELERSETQSAALGESGKCPAQKMAEQISASGGTISQNTGQNLVSEKLGARVETRVPKLLNSKNNNDEDDSKLVKTFKKNVMTTSISLDDKVLEIVLNVSEPENNEFISSSNTTELVQLKDSPVTPQPQTRTEKDFEDLQEKEEVDSDSDKSLDETRSIQKLETETPLTVISNERVLVVTEVPNITINYRVSDMPENASNVGASPGIYNLNLHSQAPDDKDSYLSSIDDITGADRSFRDSPLFEVEGSEGNIEISNSRSAAMLEQTSAESQDVVDDQFDPVFEEGLAQDDTPCNRSYHKLNLDKRLNNLQRRKIRIMQSSTSDVGDEGISGNSNRAKLSPENQGVGDYDQMLDSQVTSNGILHKPEAEKVFDLKLGNEFVGGTLPDPNNNNTNFNNINNSKNNKISNNKIPDNHILASNENVKSVSTKENTGCSQQRAKDRSPKHVTFSEEAISCSAEDLISKEDDRDGGDSHGFNYNYSENNGLSNKCNTHVRFYEGPDKAKQKKNNVVNELEEVINDDTLDFPEETGGYIEDCHLYGDQKYITEQLKYIFDKNESFNRIEGNSNRGNVVIKTEPEMVPSKIFTGTTAGVDNQEEGSKLTIPAKSILKRSKSRSDEESELFNRLSLSVDNTSPNPPSPPKVLRRLDAIKVTDLAMAQTVLKKAFEDREFDDGSRSFDDQDVCLGLSRRSCIISKRKQKKNRRNGVEPEEGESKEKITVKSVEVQTTKEHGIEEIESETGLPRISSVLSFPVKLGVAIFSIVFAILFLYFITDDTRPRTPFGDLNSLSAGFTME